MSENKSNEKKGKETMAWYDIVGGAVVGAANLIKDEKVSKFLVGTYADGETRNITDAVNGEFLSPKQKENWEKKKKKKNKRKKKNKPNFKL